VLFFGNVRPYKGLSDLIDAFPLVLPEVAALLVIAGTFFESLEAYEERIKGLGIAADVFIFPHYVPDDEVGALFSLADVVVLPYRSGSQTGVAPLAAELGKPVVATDVGGISEGLGSMAKVTADRPAELAAAIVRSLRDAAPSVRPVPDWESWAQAVVGIALGGGSSQRS
jgi:glycosyltransferase involved in cell wall biosynthesis